MKHFCEIIRETLWKLLYQMLLAFKHLNNVSSNSLFVYVLCFIQNIDFEDK